MIFTITGRPRNGKSLYAIDYIQKKAEREGRQVYYSRIEGIKFPNWVKLDDAKQWQDCPPGSIILFDEAHYDFPNRTSTSHTPPHVLGLNVHGHAGYDLYFISQAPKFLDPNVRGLTQEHHHVVRHFGREKATIHRWDVIKDNPDNKSSKQDSIKQKFIYPKARFSQYVSSADHNVKENVPLKYKLLYIIPIIIFALIGKVGYSWYQSLHKEPIKQELPVLDKLPTKPIENAPQLVNASAQSQQSEKLTYLQSYTPEIPDIVESAPVYRANHQTTQIPRPQACIASKKRCKCYTSQATFYPASDSFCRNVAANGYFIDDLQTQQSSPPQTTQPLPLSQPPLLPLQSPT